MLPLSKLKKGLRVAGIVPNEIVEIRTVDHDDGDDFYTVFFRNAQGEPGERILYPEDEPKLSLIQGKVLTFTGDSSEFRLAIEAKRIQWAYLFDPMMAVSTSTVMPLPHQITAVYEDMLPKQPLRFLLADDPGAGKTIMAGLLISEMNLRADAQKVLIVAPGSLVEQWQDEMQSKFGLRFEIFTPERVHTSVNGNPFKEAPFWVARVDQLSRNDDYQKLIEEIPWDLIVVDEAHKLSAHYSGNDVKRTKRFSLGEMLSDHTRNFLLMTATPHNGKEEDFQLFLSLLDHDRFYGKGKEQIPESELNDIMRRMVKEDMRKFDGKRLFPDRVAETAEFTLSPKEYALYTQVTDYVCHEMNRAEALKDTKKKNVVGFSLTMLQRRLASSPEAIYQSLKRRHQKLVDALEEVRRKGEEKLPENLFDVRMIDEESQYDDYSGEEQEEFDENITSQATAARTIQELSAEIEILKDLETQAYNVCLSNEDSKWRRLAELLESEDLLLNKKLIIFTEHKDTLLYLEKKIGTLTGEPDSIRCIHGAVPREERLKIQNEFRNDPTVRFLIATDAAGEGVNLQNTNLMINYDLPWNPNRIEQRFGRIHRIGQTETCYLWNMVALGTREGDVFKRLFDKLKIQRADLGGRVFDVLGEVFQDRSLKDILLESIRDDGIRKAKALEDIDRSINAEHFRDVLTKEALCQDILSNEKILSVKRRMEEAEARRLQPFYVQSFFDAAFRALHGSISERVHGRFEIRHVPAVLQNYRPVDRNGDVIRLPIAPRYDRICFDKSAVDVNEGNGSKKAEFIHPGHPLLQAVVQEIQKKFGESLEKGAVFIDPQDDEGLEPRIMALVEMTLHEEAEPHRVVSKQLKFYFVSKEGEVTGSGFAPHLDLKSLTKEEERILNGEIEKASSMSLAKEKLNSAAQRDSKEFLDTTQSERNTRLDRIQTQVRKRLTTALMTLDRKLAELRRKHRESPKPGDEARIEKTNNQIRNLKERLEARQALLEAQKKIYQDPPKVQGYALVIPQGVINHLPGHEIVIDINARRRIERLAMDAVMKAERSIGYVPVDCSKENKGWDIVSSPRSGNGDTRFIEVKGRALSNPDGLPGGENVTIHVSKNEVLQGFNLKDKFLLAFVGVKGDCADEPLYIRNPFDQQPGWAESGRDFSIKSLLTRAGKAGEV